MPSMPGNDSGAERPSRSGLPVSTLTASEAQSGEQPSARPRALVLLSPRTVQLLLLSYLLPVAQAQDLVPAQCDHTNQSAYWKPEEAFDIPSWLGRGHCVRGNGNYAQCQANLRYALGNLDSIHSTEYSAAAGVLTLLPTIGAVFGTPTSETWALLTLVPFGGSLAMLLSFGSTIMPDRLEDYENAFSRHSIRIQKTDHDDVDDDELVEDAVSYERKLAEDMEKKNLSLQLLSKKIRTRLNQRKHQGLSRILLVLGLVAMIALFFGVQVSMAIVEYGSVYSNYCTMNVWFHAWYIIITFIAVIDNWSHLPFEKHWKFYISSIPYDVEVTGGEAIDADFGQSQTEQLPAADMVGLALKQLSTVKPAAIRLTVSSLPTQHRSSILVMVSVAHDLQNLPRWRSGLQILAKCGSVIVFVFGTCIFSAVSLLAMPMVQMVVVLILAAGIGSRLIAKAIVAEITKTEPMVHVVTNDESQAFEAIAEIFRLQQKPDMNFQVEVKGQIFVDGKRVGKRSQWHRRILGVLASTYDLRKVKPYDMSNK
ncbi:hypothetical protein BP5796_06115 [Coleophoma crateriformis]|uniref:Uncharacterized protein n=1 Tax=Coleophoma crateriformis TaxID=565419 RepID=A0A3D8RW34_9HELO|nr:hypothetical protein BP5796_06115 [Coleophoma crateriformis]